MTVRQVKDALVSWYRHAGCEYIKRVSPGKYVMIESVAMDDLPFGRGTGEGVVISPNVC